MKLEWQPIAPGTRGARSTCGKYSICSITQNGAESWQAWRLAPSGPWFAPLQVGLASIDEAKAAAEADVESRLA